jgi:hypothetical protein
MQVDIKMLSKTKRIRGIKFLSNVFVFIFLKSTIFAQGEGVSRKKRSPTYSHVLVLI